MTIFYLLEIRDGRAVRFHIYARPRGGARRGPRIDSARDGGEDRAVGKQLGPGVPSRSRPSGSRSTRTRSASRTRSTATRRRPGRRAFATSSRRRCSASSTAPGDGPGDPRPRGRDELRAMVHGGQEFDLGRAGLRRRRDHDHRDAATRSTSGTARASTSSSPSPPTRTARETVRGDLDQHRPRGLRMAEAELEPATRSPSCG